MFESDIRHGASRFFSRSAASGPAAGDDEEVTPTFRTDNDTKIRAGEIGCAKQNARVGIEGDASIEDTRKNFNGLDTVVIRPQVLLHD